MKEIELYGDGVGKVSYVQHVGDDKMIANAARVSFGQDNTKPLTKRDKGLIKYLIEHKHTSPFVDRTQTHFPLRTQLDHIYVRGSHVCKISAHEAQNVGLQ
jgi:hypothetical protein